MLASTGPSRARNQPGAMTMAMRAIPTVSSDRALRIGVVVRGAIIEERIFRQPTKVRVGGAEGNDLMLPGDSLRGRFDLFERVGNALFLCFREDMTGRVGEGAGAYTLEELRKLGRTRCAGGVHRMRLSPNARGKLRLGDVTLLFQLIAPPPITPKPQLPASARGGFVAAIDWLFTAAVVCSYAGFFGGIVYLENADWPMAAGIQTLPDAVADMIFSEPEPPPEPSVETPPVSDSEVVATPTPTPSPSPERHASNTPPSHDTRAQPQMTAEARARITAEAGATAAALIIGALGEQGALADALRHGALVESAEEVMATVNGVRVAERSRADTLHERGGGQPTGHGHFGFHTVDTREIDEGPGPVEVRVRGRVRITPEGGDTGGTGDIPTGVVTRTIRRRIRAIQRCYERQLSHEPNLRGKVTVGFTVVERGTVSHARVTDNTSGSEALGRCVAETVGRLRFNPGPEGGSVDFSYPFVFAPQQ